MTKAAATKAADPEARPSRPSVRFTALAEAMMMRTAHTPQPQPPRSMPSSRAKASLVEMPTQWMHSMVKVTATRSCPADLARLLRPRFRWNRMPR